MKRISVDFRSGLGKVRGLGSAHHGVSHWWLQRVTAVALIPLSLWFVYSLMSAMLLPSYVKVAQWFTSPLNTVGMVLLLTAMAYHAKLGMQVIIEDYIHRSFSKYALLFLDMFFCITLVAVGILAVMKLHFLENAAGSL